MLRRYTALRNEGCELDMQVSECSRNVLMILCEMIEKDQSLIN